MTQHPKGLILSILADAGIPPSELHPIADRIVEAYDDANRLQVEYSGPFGFSISSSLGPDEIERLRSGAREPGS